MIDITESSGATKQLIGAPAIYEDSYEYRLWLYWRWMADAVAAREAAANINDNPYYGSPLCGGGWRVD